MSTRFLTVVLGGLLVVGVVLSALLLWWGPRRVEQQTIELFEAKQEILAEQGAARLAAQLSEVRLRLSTLATLWSEDLSAANMPEQSRATLLEIREAHQLPEFMALLAYDDQGKFLANGPRASEDLVASIEPLPVPATNDGIWMLPEACADCVDTSGRILMITRLEQGAFLASSVDIEPLAAQTLSSLIRARSTHARIEADGRVLYESAADVDEDDEEYLVGVAQVPQTDWTVHVAAPRAAVASEVRAAAQSLLGGAVAIILVLLAGIGLLVVIDRREHAQQLARTRALARQDKLATLGMLSASIAHEIRNAITVATLQLKVAEDEASEDLAGHIQRASRSVRRLATLAEDLSGYVDEAEPRSTAFDLVSAVSEALAIVRPKFDSSVDIDVDAPDHDVVISGVRNTFEQVVVNLLLNAYDAVRDQDDARIDIGIAFEKDVARLTVFDNGPGIEPRLIEEIFEPFVTTKGPGDIGGSGLGLWLSSQIVAQFDGTICAENVDQGGACFVIELPARRPS